MLVAAGLGLSAVVGLAVWLLGAGPIRLAFLDRPIATAIGRLAPDLVIEVGTTMVARSGRGLALQVAGVRLLDRDGSTILALPELRVRPSLGALLRGHVVIARVDVADAELALTRRPDGTWALAGDGGDAGIALGALLGGAGRGGASQALPRIVLARTRLTVADARTGVTTTLRDGDVVLSANSGQVDATFAALLDVVSTGGAVDGRMRLAIRASASAAVAGDGTVGDAQFTVTGDAGELWPAGDRGDPLALADLEATGTFMAAVQTLRFSRLTTAVGSSRLDAKASVLLRDTPMLAFEGTVDTLTLAGLARLWPPSMAPAVRGWLGANLRAGELRRCRVQLALHAAGGPANAYDVACDFTGVTADYLAPLDPIRAATGSAHLTAERFTVDVVRGEVGACRVDGGTLAMDLAVDPPRAEIAADVSGATADVLALIERPPIAFVPPLGIVRTDVGGESRVHTELRLPITTTLAPGAVGVTATATLTGASLPALAGGVGLTDGQLAVRVDGATVDVQGATALTGLPMLTKPVQLALKVGPGTRPSERRASLTLRGDGVSVEGTGTAAADTLRTLAVDRLQLGGSDVAGSIDRRPDGTWNATLRGPRLDLQQLLAGKPVAVDGATLTADYALTLDLERVRTPDGVEIQSLRGSVQGNGTKLGALSLTGAVALGGDFQVTLAAGPGVRRVTVTSAHAGPLLQTVGDLRQVVGGSLALEATTDGRGPFAFLEGTLVLRDFKVVRAPILGKILGIGSLGGIAALVQGEGLPFSAGHFPFQWDGKRLALHDVRAIGAVGLTADGVLDQAAGTCDVRGNVIPAYSLNSALGKVPLLGRFLVGAKGDGVFGIDYRVAGRTADPNVTVNPLTSVAPTVLRSWFVDPFRRFERRGPNR